MIGRGQGVMADKYPDMSTGVKGLQGVIPKGYASYSMVLSANGLGLRQT